jgi:hypothetical protein
MLIPRSGFLRLGLCAALAVSGCSGNSGTPSNNQPPNGTITAPAVDVSVAPGAAVTFRATCTDPDGDAVTHAWDFGGGAPNSTAQNPGSVTFANAGSFTVTYTCTDSHGLADPTPDTRHVFVETQGTFTLGGTLTFDKVRSTSSGLDYSSIAQRPLRGVGVAVVRAADPNTVLASGVTGLDGSYSLGWTGSSAVKVVVFARTANPKISVQDNTSSGAIWAVSSQAVDATAGSTVSLNVPSGWNGTSYTSRASGPFAVLDAATEAVLGFLAVRPAVVFPDLEINWSPNNAPVGPQGGETAEQAYAAGHITTSHWNGTALYILGKENVDTDEFDDHVIVHEWGHYFESKLGRADNTGGPHGPGELKDPRLAFSEGWGNALSAIIWSPNTVYTDTSGPSQGRGFGFDLEDNTAIDAHPGWYSEASVQAILYDLFDDSGASEPFDGVALGLGPIYDVQVGAQKNTPALTTLFSFIAGLKAASPGEAAAIDVLTEHNGVVVNPISDAYGSSETNASGNNGGSTDNLPLYRAISVNTPVVAPLVGGAPNNLSQNRFFGFVGDGASYKVQLQTTPTSDDVDVAVYQTGVVVAQANGSTGNETSTTFTAQNNAVYIIVVTGFGTAGDYQTTVTLQPGP